MCAPAAVGVDDNLAAGEAGVAVRAADHKAAAGVEVEDGLLVQVLGRHHGLDDVLHQVLLTVTSTRYDQDSHGFRLSAVCSMSQDALPPPQTVR